MKKTTLLLALLALSISIGCSDNDSPTAPVEEPEPVPMVTDTFGGNLALGETSCHVFTAVNVGNAEMKITELTPLSTLTLGLGLGRDDGDDTTPCSYFASDQSVRIGNTLQSQLIELGDYCVCIFDVGNVFPDQTVAYTIEVVHP